MAHELCEEWTIVNNSGQRETRDEASAVGQARGGGDLALGSGARDREKEADISEFCSAPVVTVSSHNG